MLSIAIPNASLAQGLLWLCALGPVFIIASILYNLYLHPLRHVPGPFWARASEVLSWYHTVRGKRHIWLWQQFQIYGKKVRVAPNLVLFCDPEAHAAIYSMKSNVRRSLFYTGLSRNIREITTLNTVDPTEHARRRKILNTCFTENSVQAVSAFMVKHIDRWHQIMLDENNSTTEWSASVDFGERLDQLVFDIMGDLSFGRSFNLKEPEENPLKDLPHNISQYLKFYYPMCRSPLLKLIIWLKPRGLDRLIELITPPAAQKFNEFVLDSVTKRIELYKTQADIPEEERRQDMFYFLCGALDPTTGRPAYTGEDLRAEASLLIVAGSDTTTASLASIFFYLTGSPRSYQKLVDELLRTFATAEEIVQGQKLMGCVYLRACIDEGIRMVPPGPCEPPREVLPGGLYVLGEYYPEGTIVGTSPWCDSRNEEVYGDPGVFRPERWIIDEATGNSPEIVSKLRANFRPFLSGPGNCAGKNVALAELMLVVARTLYRFDLRRAPGSTLGQGSPEMGWGARDSKQFQVVDAFVSLKEGPELLFRKRVFSEEKST